MNKELIEQAAREYAKENSWYPGETSYESDIRAMEESFAGAFKSGAEWQSEQSPWISVEERLPEENTGVFFVVEWKDLHKGYFVGLYYGNGQWESDHRLFLPDASLGRITHWMPIPKFNV